MKMLIENRIFATLNGRRSRPAASDGETRHSHPVAHLTLFVPID
jgi:hypothetical protein